MAFKSLAAYNEEKNKDFFILPDDGHSADVVILYKDINDVLIGDVHYVKSAGYSGYVQCCGKGCPACAKGIRVQTKLFIPVYNIAKRKVEFFDRSNKFQNQLVKDVFERYPDPSSYVFSIIRHGAAGDQETKYEIRAVGRNSSMPYEKILADLGINFPDYYEQVCKDLSASELSDLISVNSSVPTEEYSGYTPVPRSTIETPTVPTSSGIEPPVDDLPDVNFNGDLTDDLSEVNF